MKPEVLEKYIAKDSELSIHSEYLKKLFVPSADIAISSNTPKKHESRFGGQALVANDFVWPKHEIGEYRFLGQINFKEIIDRPSILPDTGLLSLFYAYDEDGEIFWGDDGYILGYYWPKLDGLSLISSPSGKYSNSKKIILTGGLEIPRHEDLRNDWPFDTEILYGLAEDINPPEDYMLGYPSFYTLAYDPTPGTEWISLLTLTSYDEFDWCWHDGDKLMVFIESDKLVSKEFSHLKSDAG